MLKSLIRFSIDHAALVLVLAGAVLALAAWRLPRAPVDVFPELNVPTVVVMTEAPGLAADEVEQYVSFPLESAVNGIPGVRRVRTSSAIGLSIAYVEFDWGMDIYRARQLVSERLDAVREDLPPGAHAEMTPITSITGEIMLLAVSSPDGSLSPLELRAYAEFDLRTRLLGIPGVAQVAVIGGELPEYQVLVEEEPAPGRGRSASSSTSRRTAYPTASTLNLTASPILALVWTRDLMTTRHHPPSWNASASSSPLR